MGVQRQSWLARALLRLTVAAFLVAVGGCTGLGSARWQFVVGEAGAGFQAGVAKDRVWTWDIPTPTPTPRSYLCDCILTQIPTPTPTPDLAP